MRPSILDVCIALGLTSNPNVLCCIISCLGKPSFSDSTIGPKLSTSIDGDTFMSMIASRIGACFKNLWRATLDPIVELVGGDAPEMTRHLLWRSLVADAILVEPCNFPAIA